MRFYSFSFFFLAPLSHPRLFLAPPGEKEEPTATFGRVFKAKKYPLEKHVGKERDDLLVSTHSGTCTSLL